MKQKDKEQAIFGSFDGVTSSLGVVVALLLQHQSTTHLFNTILGLAVGSGISMGYGEYLADNQGNVERAIIMALATFFGVFIPAAPFMIWSNWLAYLWCFVLLYFTCNYVGKLRGREPKLTYQVYYGIILVTSSVVLIEWLMGGIS